MERSAPLLVLCLKVVNSIGIIFAEYLYYFFSNSTPICVGSSSQ